ncbi:MAG: hypothetical protein ACRELB_05190, partial [Polyangiaceae bacterium]
EVTGLDWSMRGGSLMVKTGVDGERVGWSAHNARTEGGDPALEFHVWLGLPRPQGGLLYDPSTRYAPELAYGLGWQWAREVRPFAYGTPQQLRSEGYDYQEDAETATDAESVGTTQYDAYVVQAGLETFLLNEARRIRAKAGTRPDGR